jgi:fructose-1,6-bisphosphatase/inositol monophosphatase family enzyme
MEQELEEYLDFAKDIAKYAGEVMIKYFNQNNGSSYKGDKTIVTLADTEINSYLIKRVKEQYPSHSVDGEEEQFGKSDYVWVCDPVDGTAMYARHIPVAVFSLALVVEGKSIIGVVYDPFTNNLYSAIKGKGSYKNNEKITVNNYELDDMKAVCNSELWPGADYDISKVVQELGKKAYFVGVGSIIRACMCVATGDFNLAIFQGTKHKNCDIAAVKVIVEEAGGKVTDLFGNEQRYDESINGAVISNGKVHSEVIETNKKYLIDRKK